MTTTRRPPSYLTEKNTKALKLSDLPDRPADDAVAQLGLGLQPMRQGAQKGVAISRQERLAGRDHGGILAIGKRKRLGHGILP